MVRLQHSWAADFASQRRRRRAEAKERREKIGKIGTMMGIYMVNQKKTW
jgi:hypothetical protein